MKHIHYIVLLTLLFVAHTAVAGGITVIHAGWLLAVPGTSPVERQSIIIENDRISRVANGFISRSELMRIHFVMRDGVVYRLNNSAVDSFKVAAEEFSP